MSADTLRYDARGKLLTVRRLTRVQCVGTEHVDLAYSGLGAVVAQERRFSGNQWQIEEYRSDPLGHLYWNQSKSFADGPQLEQRSVFTLQTGALTSRAAAFPQNPTGSTVWPDEVTADQAEQRVLWDLQAQLESLLTEPLEPNYADLLNRARQFVTRAERSTNSDCATPPSCTACLADVQNDTLERLSGQYCAGGFRAAATRQAQHEAAPNVMVALRTHLVEQR